MRKVLTAALIATLLVSGCATIRDSRANPFNWFGRSQSEPVEQTADPAAANPLIPARRGGLFRNRRERLAEVDLTTPIATVTALRIERVPGGAIIRATGEDRTQFPFSIELVPEIEDELPVDSVLTYTLERQQPRAPVVGGPVQTREVVVARRLTDQQLEGVRTIRVVAAENTRTARR